MILIKPDRMTAVLSLAAEFHIAKSAANDNKIGENLKTDKLGACMDDNDMHAYLNISYQPNKQFDMNIDSLTLYRRGRKRLPIC